MQELGRISLNGDSCFFWYIDNYYVNSDIPSLDRSPRFRFDGVAYVLALCKYKTCTYNYTVLHLCRSDGSPFQSLYFEFYISTDQRILSPVYCFSVRNKRLILTADVNLREYVPDYYRSLYISFHIVLSMAKLSQAEKLPVELQSERASGKPTDYNKDSYEEKTYSDNKHLKRLQKDFEKLFLDDEDCDVTLEVGDEIFTAHTIILRARSPVFNAMFSHDMDEKRSGNVVIEDCDAKTFPDFLNYLYTGNTNHISGENVCQLFTASDKYQVEELKAECVEFMKINMSVESFCDFIALAIKHTNKDLNFAASEFFCVNAVEIAKTAKWHLFSPQNPTVVNDLFLKALLKGGKNKPLSF